jgi:hypothetical protein
MDVIEYAPTREQYAYTFGGAAPVMRVEPGPSCGCGPTMRSAACLRSVDDLSSAKVDLRFVNPQTGPFYVEGPSPATPWCCTSSRWSRPATGERRPRSRSSAA